MTLRLFVALDLPREAREALAAFRATAAHPEVWRPVGDAALHVTLAFLGQRPEEDAGTAAGVLLNAAGEAPRLMLGEALALPPRRPRVLTAEVGDPDGTLAALQADVGAGLADAGIYEPEARPFRAHVTVARLRSGAIARRVDVPAPERVEFHGRTVTLYRSHLARGGARYEALASVRLRG